MDKKQVSDQIIRDISNLPNEKLFTLILKHTPQDDMSDARKLLFQWLITGEINYTAYTHMDAYYYYAGESGVIRSIVSLVISVAGIDAQKLISDEILKLFGGLDDETKEQINRKRKLIDSMDNIRRHILGRTGYHHDRYFIDFLVDGKNDEPDKLESEYADFIIDPNELIKDKLTAFDKYNYDEALDMIKWFIEAYFADESLEKLNKLPYEEQLEYGLTIGNEHATEDDFAVIYKYFYPAFDVPNIK